MYGKKDQKQVLYWPMFLVRLSGCFAERIGDSPQLLRQLSANQDKLDKSEPGLPKPRQGGGQIGRDYIGMQVQGLQKELPLNKMRSRLAQSSGLHHQTQHSIVTSMLYIHLETNDGF